MPQEFLTLEEAKVLTQKSESTLRRLIKKALASKKKSKWVQKKKRKTGGYQYFIHPRLLEVKEEDKTPTPKRLRDQEPILDNLKVKASEKQDSKEVGVLKKYIESLERQLSVKDQQIFEFLERDRENHALLEKINEALIKFRVPEYIETQIESTSFEESKTENLSDVSGEENKQDGLELSKGSFGDWLRNLG